MSLFSGAKQKCRRETYGHEHLGKVEGYRGLIRLVMNSRSLKMRILGSQHMKSRMRRDFEGRRRRH